MATNPNCVCPYLVCKIHGNCMACVAHSRENREFPNCLESVVADYGGCLPRKYPRNTIICDTYEDMSAESARIVATAANEKEGALLCLPAGNTAIRTYEICAQMQAEGEVDFSKTRFVQLDDWYGLEDTSESCEAFMHKYFYGPLGIRPEQIREFDLEAEDPEEECRAVDRYIEDAGGIDLMLLGIGMNGHIALNEPGENFDHGTHIVELSETTKSVGQKYFSKEMQLSRGITLGMRQVFSAKKVVLQAGGKAKAQIIAQLYAARPQISMPASVLALVEDGVVILDKDAASEIDEEIRQEIGFFTAM